MGLVVHLHELVDVQMGVLLRGRQACMPQQLLYGAKISARIEHMRGK